MSNSMFSLLRLIAFLPLIYINTASADIALLIHGFDSHSSTWQQSGINQYLHQQGWPFYGVLNDQGHSVGLQPSGLISPSVQGRNKNKLYTVNLASRAPIEYQSHQLNRMIQWLNRVHPLEPVYLIGHSAGGLVARYMLVRWHQEQGANNISGLISIASPHLGTFRAAQAIDAIDEPFFCPGPGWRFLQSVFADDEYDVLRKSKRLLYELYPSQPNNLIFWLNQQEHPNIAYFSIIRSSGVMMGDMLVPGYSQDMNNVPALNNQSITLLSQNGHFLTPQDALLIHSTLTLLSDSL